MGAKHTFAKKLKELRKEAGLKQADLADKLKMSKGAISYYETEERTPDIEFLDGMATLFGKSTDYLLGRSDFEGIKNRGITAEELGLSERAIEVLAKHKAAGLGSGREDIIAVINLLIEQEDFFLRLEKDDPLKAAAQEEYMKNATPILSPIGAYLKERAGSEAQRCRIGKDGSLEIVDRRSAQEGCISVSALVDTSLFDSITSSLKTLRGRKPFSKPRRKRKGGTSGKATQE